MKNISILFIALLSAVTIQAQTPVQTKDGNGNLYTHYENDPTGSRWYTLKNGLTVVLAVNREKPSAQTLIATKAGSSSDPSDHTGLAHYLEHMLFKGTDKYGSLDYKKEKIYLDQIDELYEEYNHSKDENVRKEIYHRIDSVSGIAAKYAIANEYDKMMQTIGASGTNAFTSYEQTVYVNNIPSNQINTWLDIEAERYRNPILRLFHTELEAVYEEKNRTLDNDSRKVSEALMASAFPNHNYGMQTTIGTIEHLKNPSLKAIRDYYKTYYVPNNMAVIIAGDINMDQTFEWIKAKFAYMKPGKIPAMTFKDEVVMVKPDVIDVYGPDASSLRIAYRMPDALEQDAVLLQLVDLIFSNSNAGLIDLNLVKAQKVLRAYCYPTLLKERGLHTFVVSPLEGQSLKEAEQLIYNQIELLKNGEFDMELIRSIVLNQKVDQIRQYEQNPGIAYDILESFILGKPWEQKLQTFDKMLTYSKENITAFAKKYYTEGHTVVYKHQGESDSKLQIEKPEITKVDVNRDAVSPFVVNINKRDPGSIKPQILNYNEDIVFDKYKYAPIWKVKEGDKQLFDLYYVLDLGSQHDKKLALAISYLQYLGTEKMNSEQISKEFYKLACDFGVSAGDEQSYVYLRGLHSNFDEALKLFEDLLANVQPDPHSLEQLKAQILKRRADSKLNKNTILFSKMTQYAMYGPENAETDILSEGDLMAIQPEELVTYIKNLTSYKHKIWYNGPLEVAALKETLAKYHTIPDNYIASPKLKEYQMLDVEKTKIYFVDYDMVQAEIVWLKKSNEFNKDEVPTTRMFNEYFGGGMSSIVFQEIRESKALAYSTFGAYATADKKEDHNYVFSYVGTQADKSIEAIDAMNELLAEIPKSDPAYENAKTSVRQNLETSRILEMGVLFDYDKSLKLGYTEDMRQQLREEIDGISIDDILAFHKAKLDGQYVMCILASKENLNLEKLSNYGEVIELSLEQIYGY